MSRDLKVKTLEFVQDPDPVLVPPSCLFRARTPVGDFAYGCDLEGVIYWVADKKDFEGEDVGSLEEARLAAIKSYEKAVLNHPVIRLLETAK